MTIALTSHDHTVSGIRVSVIPSQRSATMVVSRLTAPTAAAMQKMPMLTSHTSMPSACPGPAAGTALKGG